MQKIASDPGLPGIRVRPLGGLVKCLQEPGSEVFVRIESRRCVGFVDVSSVKFELTYSDALGGGWG